MRGLVVAQFFSGVGSAVVTLAIAFLSYEDSKSVLHTVLVSAAYSLPTAVLGMYAGRLAGRVSRRHLLLVINLVKTGLYLGMAVLAALDLLNVPGLMVVSLLAGTLSAFNSPAWMEFERDVVPPDRLEEANAMLGAASSSAAVIGAALGAAAARHRRAVVDVRRQRGQLPRLDHRPAARPPDRGRSQPRPTARRCARRCATSPATRS